MPYKIPKLIALAFLLWSWDTCSFVKLKISLAVEAWISSPFKNELVKFLSLDISAANLSSICE